ncbi:unnamed protein product [Soboliphyme baturini]|uniref:Exported protein n=1 Tax=Soboliphyme baturini TaxID=241478 RepID=A0A183ICI8_9BILA|nr:unnamed protein product [Soboliphyme baturini]
MHWLYIFLVLISIAIGIWIGRKIKLFQTSKTKSRQSNGPKANHHGKPTSSGVSEEKKTAKESASTSSKSSSAKSLKFHGLKKKFIRPKAHITKGEHKK